jgi:VIT1/CCC1 family predicted Fe2+/Mn2+ transporter
LSGVEARQTDSTVMTVGLAVAVLAIVLFVLGVQDAAPIADAPLQVSGWWLGVAFFGCELFAIRVERRQGQT